MQGSYDATIDACVISPNLQYLCLRGELNENMTSCVVTPDAVITCPVGDYNQTSGTCEVIGEVTTIISQIREDFPIFGDPNVQMALLFGVGFVLLVFIARRL